MKGGDPISLFQSHPLYDLTCHRLLKTHGGQAVLDNPDAYEFFKAGLPTLPVDPAPTPAPPTPTPPSGHPILDALIQAIQWAVSHPADIAAFIQMILALFPK